MIISKIICFSSLLQIMWIMFKDKEKRSNRNTNRWVSFIKIGNYVRKRTIHYHVNDRETIYNESFRILIDPRNKLKHKIEAFIHCCSSLPLLKQAFRRYCVDLLINLDATFRLCRICSMILTVVQKKESAASFMVRPNFHFAIGIIQILIEKIL